MIEDGETGVLVPANDPYTLACEILMLSNDKDRTLQISKNARKAALTRHNKDRIKSELLHIYNEIANAKALNKIL